VGEAEVDLSCYCQCGCLEGSGILVVLESICLACPRC
jgi:hypothetical protein